MSYIARVRLLGKPSVTDSQDTLIPGLGNGKPFAILAYLLIRKEARRDELVALLWGEGNESKSRNAFRQSFHRLRAALGGDIFNAEREYIELDVERVWSDVTSFEAAIAAGNPEEAINLYKGPFLDGFSTGEVSFDNWVFDQQSRLKARYLGTLQQWTQEALTQGQWDAAVQRSETLLHAAPLDVDAAVLSANALVAAGRRGEALATLKGFTNRFQRDLEQPPPLVVREMITRLDSSAVKETLNSASPLLNKAENLSDEDAQIPAASKNDLYSPSQLGKLLKSWKRVTSGKGTTVLVQGGPEAGKDQLIADFLARVSALDSALVLHGTERSGSYTIPYASVAEALRAAIGAPGVAGASQHLLAEAARLLPELRDQFNLPEPGSVADDASRVRFFDGIAALIDAAAYEQPVCLILEDVHNASDGTVELVHYLTTRLNNSQVLIVISYRGSGSAIAQRYTDMQTSASLDRIDLGGDDVDSINASTEDNRRTWRDYLGTRPAIAASLLILLLSAVAIAFSTRATRGLAGRTNALTDTLILMEHRGPNEASPMYYLAGNVSSDLEELPDGSNGAPQPEWTKSLQLPWINPSTSPDGRYVAIERMSAKGTDVYLISSDKRDSLPIATGIGDDIFSGWAPDGSALLVIHTDTGSGRETSSKLYAYSTRRGRTPVLFDSTPGSVILQAAWSPVGTHVAWTSRSTENKQQDIFVARADASGLSNLTNNPAEDYNLAWSPDGNWIAFTSEREGSADLYAVEILTGRLRRLTWEPGQDDRASFSTDGRFVAYESVRDGERGIYITAFWGGTPKRVSPPNKDRKRLSITGWRGEKRLPYLNKILVSAPKEFTGAANVSARAVDQYGDSIKVSDIEWVVLDSATAKFQAAPLPRTSELIEDYIPSGRIVGVKPGPARLVASAPGWRAETTFVVVK